MGAKLNLEDLFRLNLLKPAQELERDYFFVGALRFKTKCSHVFLSRMLPALFIFDLIQNILDFLDWIILINFKNLNYAYLAKKLSKQQLEKILITNEANELFLQKIASLKETAILAYETSFFLKPIFAFIAKKSSISSFLFYSRARQARCAHSTWRIQLIKHNAYKLTLLKSKEAVLVRSYVYNFCG